MPDHAIASKWIAIAASAILVLSFAAPAAGPESLANLVSRYFDEAFLLKSAEYHRFNLILFLVQTCVLLTALSVFTHGRLGKWSRLALILSRGRLWPARAVILSMAHITLGLLRLPFSIVRYYHAYAYQLRDDSLAIYLFDWLKGFLIVWLMVIVVGLIILDLYARFPRWWTVLATFATGFLAAGYVLLSPLIVDPLFYEFHPLEDPVLKQRIFDLSSCADLEIGEILVADASRHSQTVNAYVNGIGRTARIVLYDTLLQKFTPDEIAIVLAHEIGHWTRGHIPKALLLGILGILIALLIADRVLGLCVRNHFRGITTRHDPALALPGYALYVVLTLAALLPGNAISRHMEAEADRAALELTGDPDTFVQTKVRIAHANLSDVLPPAWVEFALFTHPSIARRIWMAENFRNHRNRGAESCSEDPDR